MALDRQLVSCLKRALPLWVPFLVGKLKLKLELEPPTTQTTQAGEFEFKLVGI